MRYLSVNEIQMAYDLLVGANPQIINDAQEFVELLVRVYEDGKIKVGWNEVRQALRSL
jgi:hypothetical protein